MSLFIGGCHTKGDKMTHKNRKSRNSREFGAIELTNKYQYIHPKIFYGIYSTASHRKRRSKTLYSTHVDIPRNPVLNWTTAISPICKQRATTRNKTMKTFMQAALITLITISLSSNTATAAEVTGPVTEGSQGGPFSAPAFDIAAHGYIVQEFYLDGDAHAYKFKESNSQSDDGQWATQRRDETAPFKSRILVVRPAKAEDFNGTVIVHWQNVTAGYELGSVTEGEYLRGYAWVGVSAQKIGIDGFPGPDAAGLKSYDEKRYGSLSHPGDAYSYDIFTQAARAIAPNRDNGKVDPMGGLPVKRLIAAGASQSAARLRTYINGVHPVENVFDAFIPYIDFGSTIPFDLDFAANSRRQHHSTQIREDLNAPVIVVNSETETQAYISARQPDSDKFRLWEVAGTSHVSSPRDSNPPGLDNPNWLSFQPVYAASLRHMHNWIKDGTQPPRMPRIQVDEKRAVQRDEVGNALGGIQLPDFVVPTASHSGQGKAVLGGSRFAFLYGAAEDFSDDKLSALYPTPDVFLAKYDEALRQSIKDGMVLPEDAPLLLESAEGWSAKLK
jgi:hypothetical protein